MQPEFAGWVLLGPLDLVGPEIEIGWRMTPLARGHGYATEAARCVLDHAIHVLGLPRIVADIDPANGPSTAVARKIGMRPSGQTPYDGRMVVRYLAGTD
jgi:RimJ/RimL family protein N-acetyltransferase